MKVLGVIEIDLNIFVLSSHHIPWRQNSSASACQPLRRYSSFQTKRRAFAAMSNRRYSVDTKVINRLSPSLLSEKLNASPKSAFTRASAWQSQVVSLSGIRD